MRKLSHLRSSQQLVRFLFTQMKSDAMIAHQVLVQALARASPRHRVIKADADHQEDQAEEEEEEEEAATVEVAALEEVAPCHRRRAASAERCVKRFTVR